MECSPEAFIVELGPVTPWIGSHRIFVYSIVLAAVTTGPHLKWHKQVGLYHTVVVMHHYDYSKQRHLCWKQKPVLLVHLKKGKAKGVASINPYNVLSILRNLVCSMVWRFSSGRFSQTPLHIGTTWQCHGIATARKHPGILNQNGWGWDW